MRRILWLDKKIRIVQYRGKYLVMYGKERLSGPWNTDKEAVAAKQEWIV